MAYLNHDSSTIIVDAILTKKGRELLAGGKKNFVITKFALGDDEIDYSLWNPNNTKGSDYYGEIIENIPLMEANPDDSKNMRYLLTSMNSDQIAVSKIVNTPTSLTMESGGSQILRPITNNGSQTSEFGYTLTIPDSTKFRIREIGTTVEGATTRTPKVQSITGEAVTLVAVGKEFEIIAKDTTVNRTVIATVRDNLTGATLDVTLNVNAMSLLPDGTVNTEAGAS